MKKIMSNRLLRVICTGLMLCMVLVVVQSPASAILFEYDISAYGDPVFNEDTVDFEMFEPGLDGTAYDCTRICTLNVPNATSYTFSFSTYNALPGLTVERNMIGDNQYSVRISGVPTSWGYTRATLGLRAYVDGEWKSSQINLRVPIYQNITAFDVDELDSGSVGTSYLFEPTYTSSDVTNPMDTFECDESTLPEGISWVACADTREGHQDCITGYLAGTPTESGTFNVKFRLYHEVDSMDAYETLVIEAPEKPVITNLDSVPRGVKGQQYSFQLQPSGAGVVYIPNSSNEVGGLTINSAGIVSGIPDTTASIILPNVRVRVNGVESDPVSVIVRVDEPVKPVIVSPTDLPHAVQGQYYNHQLQPSGEGVVYIPNSSNDIGGITLNTDGTLTGTPTSTASLIFPNVRVKVNGVESDPAVSVIVRVDPAPAPTVVKLTDSNGTDLNGSAVKVISGNKIINIKDSNGTAVTSGATLSYKAFNRTTGAFDTTVTPSGISFNAGTGAITFGCTKSQLVKVIVSIGGSEVGSIIHIVPGNVDLLDKVTADDWLQALKWQYNTSSAELYTLPGLSIPISRVMADMDSDGLTNPFISADDWLAILRLQYTQP